MKQSEKVLHHCNLYTHRRANQVLPRDLVSSKSVQMASTFSAAPWEGSPHPSQYQKPRSK